MQVRLLTLALVCIIAIRYIEANFLLGKDRSVECRFELNDTTRARDGNFVNSPGWNGAPDVDAWTCRWIITAPENQIVGIHITQMYLDLGLDGDCNSDSIIIRNLETGEDVLRVCGYACRPTIILASRKALVEFSMLAQGFPNRGFQMFYTFIDTGDNMADLWRCNCAEGTPGCVLRPNMCKNPEYAFTGGYDIYSPGHPFPYPTNMDCTWTIQGDEDTSVVLYLGDLSLHGDCNVDRLSISYGPPNDCTTYCTDICGERPGFPLAATTKTLSIKFRSGGVRQGDAFNLRYSFTHATCGPSMLTASQFVIESPRLLNSYPPNLECTWVIELEPTQKIEITFQELNLTEDCGDFISLYDASSRNCGAKCEVKWCGKQENGTNSFVTSGNIAILTFKSDSRNSTGRGFTLSYRANGTDVDQANDAHSNETSGVTEPPHVTNNATTSNETLIDEIEGMSGDLDNSTGTNNATTNSSDADNSGGNASSNSSIIPAHDVVNPNATDGDDRLHTVGDTPGNASTNNNRLPSNVIKVPETDGVIQTPNFPNDYPINTNVGWEITGLDNQNIALFFNSFAIEETRGCVKDSFTLYAGQFADYCGQCSCTGPNDCVQFCTPNTDYIWTSPKNSVTVLFHSDETNTKKGFQIAHSPTMPACGRTEAPRLFGLLKSPGYPSSMHKDTVCTWVVKGSPQQVIVFNIESLTLPQSANCQQHYLQLTDNVIQPCDQTHCVQLCGQKTNYIWKSVSNIVVVKLVSPLNVGKSGVLVSYTVSTPECGDVFLTGESGVIESPGYAKEQPYPDNAYCSWVISPDNGKMVNLKIAFMDIVPSGDCAGDVLEIYPGNFTSVCSNDCKALCTQRQLYPETMHYGNKVSLRFKSDKSGTATGFRITYTTVNAPAADVPLPQPPSGNETQPPSGNETQPPSDSGAPQPPSDNGNPQPPNSNEIPQPPSDNEVIVCGTNITSGPGAITSPGFPESYPRNLRCKWNITAPQGKVIQLTYKEIDIYNKGGCSGDVLMTYDGPNIGLCQTNGTIWCSSLCYGFQDDYVWKSRSNVVALEFVTNNEHTAKGFQILYKFL